MRRENFLERPIQHLYPFELAVDKPKPKTNPSSTLDANARAFRLKRREAIVAQERISQIMRDEVDELTA